jgi:hypothetical protein
VIGAESQAVLNTLTEHDFQDAFKKLQKHWERCIRVKGNYILREAPPVPEIMDDTLYVSCFLPFPVCAARFNLQDLSFFPTYLVLFFICMLG